MSYVSLFSAFFITCASLVALRPVANRAKLLDLPEGERKTHAKPTPLIGGVGIYLGFTCMLVFSPDILNAYAPLALLSSLVLIIGLVDDIKGLSVPTRLCGQSLVALLMCTVADNQLASFGNLFGFGEVQLGVFGTPVTVIATVGLMNAVNMIDGLDGLAAGIVVIALSFLGISAYFAGDALTFGLLSILISSLLAFLALNLPLPRKKSARVYLGDSGSTLLGFMLAWLFIEGSQGSGANFPPSAALWFLAIPLMDMVYLFFARPLKGKSPSTPGLDHIHHLLIARGLQKSSILSIFYSASVLLSIWGLLTISDSGLQALSFPFFLILFLLYAHITRRRQGLSWESSVKS